MARLIVGKLKRAAAFGNFRERAVQGVRRFGVAVKRTTAKLRTIRISARSNAGRTFRKAVAIAAIGGVAATGSASTHKIALQAPSSTVFTKKQNQ